MFIYMALKVFFETHMRMEEDQAVLFAGLAALPEDDKDEPIEDEVPPPPPAKPSKNKKAQA